MVDLDVAGWNGAPAKSQVMLNTHGGGDHNCALLWAWVGVNITCRVTGLGTGQCRQMLPHAIGHDLAVILRTVCLLGCWGVESEKAVFSLHDRVTCVHKVPVIAHVCVCWQDSNFACVLSVIQRVGECSAVSCHLLQV